METRALGKTGLRVSVLSLGAMTFGQSRSPMNGITSSDADARRVFDRAIDLGINLVDTADKYGEGRSEELVGEWARDKRDKVLLATKCGLAVGAGTTGGPASSLSRERVLRACEDSLRRLKTDRIDLYQVHLQDPSVPIDETLRALDDLVTQGKVRYVGCSNFTGYRLVESLWSSERQRTVRFDSVQLQWNLVERGAEREVVPACRAHGLGILVYSPLAFGLLSGKYRRGEPAPAGSRLAEWKAMFQHLGVERTWAVIEILEGIARRAGVPCAAIAIAWLLARQGTTSVIVGARTTDQLDANARALDVALTPEDTRALDKASLPAWGYPYWELQLLHRRSQSW